MSGSGISWLSIFPDGDNGGGHFVYVCASCVGARQSFRVPFALFCYKNLLSCTQNGVVALKNLPHCDDHQT